MAIKGYLAMTAAEIRNGDPLPQNIGWMACHFSPYAAGLSNIPQSLPEGSLLILNDRTPIHRHDPETISRQLENCIDRLGCTGLLLDFQRPGVDETAALTLALTQALSCPVAVSDVYAADLDCPVFLPPLPLHVPLKEYFAPWRGRDIWLEITPEGETVTVTADGATFSPLSGTEKLAGGFTDDTLYCHYQISIAEEQAQFQLRRTADDWEALLAKAETMGVTTAVGLYQEFSRIHDLR